MIIIKSYPNAQRKLELPLFEIFMLTPPYSSVVYDIVAILVRGKRAIDYEPREVDENSDEKS